MTDIKKRILNGETYGVLKDSSAFMAIMLDEYPDTYHKYCIERDKFIPKGNFIETINEYHKKEYDRSFFANLKII